MKNYFVTEGSSNNYIGLNYMVKSVIDARYLETAKTELSDFEFVNLGELYTSLGNDDGAEVKIVLSKYALAFGAVLQGKYPKAKIVKYKTF
ncbi:hypothetical protein ABUK63_03500 [Lactococcus lactis]|uniref:hypothetical protein n=1 Tax=Lactococcus lactis TaxID=1358 RepID=UPI002026A5F0|nr:hypothetical protein [Lactococcus lactis]MCL9638858.1 hypothetical protein [Lactococcus lactis]